MSINIKNLIFFKKKKEYENKIKKEAKSFGVIINVMETNELKELDDYRKEEFDNRIIKIKDKIIKNIKVRKSKNKEKRIVKIIIVKQLITPFYMVIEKIKHLLHSK